MITKQNIIDVLQTIYDPEVPVNIWDMGLIYNIEISETDIKIDMTFTSPTCPLMDEILGQVKSKVAEIAGGLNVVVNLVWEPAWDLSRMSDKARLELDLTNQGW